MKAEELNTILDRVSTILDKEGTPNVEAITLCDMVLSEIEKETTGKTGALSIVGGAVAAAVGLATGLGIFLPGVIGAYMGYKYCEDKAKYDFGALTLRASALKARADNIK